jgi:hypothetical protein
MAKCDAWKKSDTGLMAEAMLDRSISAKLAGSPVTHKITIVCEDHTPKNDV